MTRAQLDLASSLAEHVDEDVRSLAQAFVSQAREVHRLRTDLAQLRARKGVVAQDALHEFREAFQRLEASLRGGE